VPAPVAARGVALAVALATLIVIVFVKGDEWLYRGGAIRLVAEFLIPLIVAAALYHAAIGLSARRPVPAAPMAVLCLAIVVVLAGGAVVALLDGTIADQSPWLIIAPFVVAALPVFLVLGTALPRVPAFAAGALTTLIVAAVAVAAAFTPKLGSTPMPSTPIATATVDAQVSSWQGRLPNPCDDVSRRTWVRHGVNPDWVHTRAHKPPILNEPDRDECAFTVKDRWGVFGRRTGYITYSTESFGQFMRSPKQGDLVVSRPTTVLGQPAAQSTTTLAGQRDNECTITVGTVFGTVAYRVVTSPSPAAERACATAMDDATALYPSVPRS